MAGFSQQQRKRVEAIVGFDLKNPETLKIVVAAIETEIFRYYLTRNESAKQARSNLQVLAKSSLAYYRVLRKFRIDNRAWTLTLAETFMREAIPTAMFLETLAEKVNVVRIAANSAYPYLPGGAGRGDDWHTPRLLRRLAKIYQVSSGIKVLSGNHKFYDLARICLTAAERVRSRAIFKSFCANFFPDS